MSESKVKAAVRARDGNRCVDCGRDSNGQRKMPVHRLVPGSSYSVEGCITVCCSCHTHRHKTLGAVAPDNNRNGSVNVNVWYNRSLAQAFESLRVREKRTKTAQLEIILTDYLKRAGLWPPAASE